MKFGLFSVNSYTCSYPETAVEIAQLGESAGFESLWAGEHVVLPDPQVPPSPMAPNDRILDPIVTLTFLAAHTRTRSFSEQELSSCLSAIRSCWRKLLPVWMNFRAGV